MNINHIIVIAGVPRSGTSWLGQIIESSPDVIYRFQPIFSYAFKEAVNVDSAKEDYERFFAGIYESSDDFLHQKDKREAGLYPTFIKKDHPEYLVFKINRYQYLLSKMLYYFKNLKLIGIVRHPCGVINSWLKNHKEFPQDADPMKEWRFGACRNKGRAEEYFGFYKWKEVAHFYLDLKDKYPNQVNIIKYEELVNDPISLTKHILNFIGLDYVEQTETFLYECHSVHKDNPYAVFKDKTVMDKWISELDPYISNEIICEIEGTRLERFL